MMREFALVFIFLVAAAGGCVQTDKAEINPVQAGKIAEEFPASEKDSKGQDEGDEENPGPDKRDQETGRTKERTAQEESSEGEENGTRENLEPDFEQKVWKERIEAVFRESYCPPPKAHSHLYYSGPMIDTHFHIAHIPDSTPRQGEAEDYGDAAKRPPLGGIDFAVGDIICAFDYEGTQSAFAFFPVFPDVTWQHLEITQRAIQKYPGRFTPFIMPPDGDNMEGGSQTVVAKVLHEMLSKKPGLFRGYGEIGLYARPGGAKGLPPDSERLRGIYRVVRENRLLVYFHLGEGQKESFRLALGDNPDINFIWHGDQLVKQVNGKQNLEDLEEILSNHPNVYYGVDELYGDVWLLRPEVSKEEFMAHFKDYEPLLQKDLETWKGFIERHPDQVLWGTDRGAGVAWSVDEDVGWQLTDYARAFISRLEPGVREKFAHKNAEKLIGAQKTGK